MLSVTSAMIAVLVGAGSASAEDTKPRFYAAVVGGYSAAVPEYAADPMGFAVGASAGLAFRVTPIYIGGLFLYHAGDSVAVGTGGAELSRKSFMLGGEVGYEFGPGPLVLRPGLGAGVHSPSARVDGQIVGANVEDISEEDALYFSPGLNAFLALGVLLGAEVRYNAVLGSSSDSISLLATLGVHTD